MDERVISDLRVEIALRVEVALGNGDGIMVELMIMA